MGFVISVSIFSSQPSIPVHLLLTNHHFCGEMAMTTWAMEELAGAKLGDGRLNVRRIKRAARFADKPTARIPGACPDWAETQAVYRFFDQASDGKRSLGWQDILDPHIAQTEARMRQHPVVLCLQDSTELDFNGQDIDGLGPLSYETQRGMYRHPTYGVMPEREPLGVTDAWMWAREKKASDGTRTGIRESLRWREGYERIAKTALTLPGTRLVYVADREADIAEPMQRAHALGSPADGLVRSKHNRCLPDGGKRWAEVLARAPLGEIEFRRASRHGQAARIVRQQIFARPVSLADGQGGRMSVTGLIAKETAAPVGVKPVEWRLLTNRTAQTLDDLVERIEWYRGRWEIEIFFNVLKNGCRVEALQLGRLGKIERALAVYLGVSWRRARWVRLGRTHPDLAATARFTDEEWKGAYILAKKPVPKTTPTLRELVRQIAMLGGFLARKSDGEPGAKTLWLGFQRIRDFVEGGEHMRSINAV